jgi:hypothetical protein
VAWCKRSVGKRRVRPSSRHSQRRWNGIRTPCSRMPARARNRHSIRRNRATSDH